ncbi:MAG TPA: serine hydrolase [Vitreimonas sp.]|uniref:serine hydrolase domain-containing protein n=1 Tax=Vitreimonas sp. TaxID=3069702 RepID=UPI002D752A1A|nr:serine hydrolase [Vitreimonas sp.]HYD88250.1 serine hydrolase [Vitreimonas sp.]
MDRRAFLAAAAACSAVSASTAQLARAQAPRRFGDAIGYSAQRNGASFMVVRHGVVLAEDYPGGHADARYPIGHGTRAFVTLLAASLAEDRLLDLDEPVAATLGDWGAHPVKSTISVRMLLSGASGVAFGRARDRSLAAAIALEPSDQPGRRFHDDPASYVLFTEIARRKLEARGREPDPARWLTTRTLLPIGCVPIGWARGNDGAPRFDDGAAVSARGWAAAGELIRREGVWRAQQLADEEVIREALRGSFAEPRAGFGLWLAAPGRGRDDPTESDLWRGRSPAPATLAMAAGQGGQRLYISPTEGLVIVRLARSMSASNQWSDAQFLSLVYRDL